MAPDGFLVLGENESPEGKLFGVCADAPGIYTKAITPLARTA